MKVLFEYNSSTGEIRDASGMTVFMIGMMPFGEDGGDGKGGDKVQDMIRLRNAGFTADEIIEITKASVI